MAAPVNGYTTQGQTVLGGDLVNTFAQWTTTANQLRGFVGLSNMLVFLEGVAAPNDGNGGVFYWNGSSTAPDDNYSVIVPTGVLVGAWQRLSFIPGGSTNSTSPTQTTNFTASTAYKFYPVNLGASSVVTLPLTLPADFEVTIKDISGNCNAGVVLSANSPVNTTTQLINTNYGWVKLYFSFKLKTWNIVG
jgi:hypothetical protein